MLALYHMLSYAWLYLECVVLIICLIDYQYISISLIVGLVVLYKKKGSLL
jgi:hypothetical protein